MPQRGKSGRQGRQPGYRDLRTQSAESDLVIAELAGMNDDIEESHSDPAPLLTIRKDTQQRHAGELSGLLSESRGGRVTDGKKLDFKPQMSLPKGEGRDLELIPCRVENKIMMKESTLAARWNRMSMAYSLQFSYTFVKLRGRGRTDFNKCSATPSMRLFLLPCR